MIRMVPTNKLPNHSSLSDFDPTHSLSSQIDSDTSVIDFDLDYLPNSSGPVDCVDLDLIAVPDFVQSPAESFNFNPPSSTTLNLR